MLTLIALLASKSILLVVLVVVAMLAIPVCMVALAAFGALFRIMFGSIAFASRPLVSLLRWCFIGYVNAAEHLAQSLSKVANNDEQSTKHPNASA